MYKSSSIIMSPLKIQLGGSYSVLTYYYLFRVLSLEKNVKLKIIRSLVGNTCSKLARLKYLEYLKYLLKVGSFEIPGREGIFNTWNTCSKFYRKYLDEILKSRASIVITLPLCSFSLSLRKAQSYYSDFIVAKIYKVEIKFSDLTVYFHFCCSLGQGQGQGIQDHIY